MSINLLVKELQRLRYDVRWSRFSWSYAVSVHNCQDDERPGGLDELVEKLLLRYGCKGCWNPSQTVLLVTGPR